MTELPLEFRQVTKRFRDKIVLRGVDLRVNAGETVGFVGPNGAGKTTCLRTAVGLAFRDGGSARVLGMDPATRGLDVRRRCCYLPGETGLYANLRGRELLEFALGFYQRNNTSLRDELIEQFELPMDQHIRHYSAGMKQKLALLTVLVPDVDLYLLDEPDRNLDPGARRIMRDALDGLRAEGKSILFSSHHLGEVGAVASRLVFLLGGRIVEEDRVARARTALRDTVRVRLAPGTALPGDVSAVTLEPDGCYRVRPTIDPLAWLQRLPAEDVLAVEIGATRLDDLFALLAEDAGDVATSTEQP